MAAKCMRVHRCVLFQTWCVGHDNSLFADSSLTGRQEKQSQSLIWWKLALLH